MRRFSILISSAACLAVMPIPAIAATVVGPRISDEDHQADHKATGEQTTGQQGLYSTSPVSAVGQQESKTNDSGGKQSHGENGASAITGFNSGNGKGNRSKQEDFKLQGTANIGGAMTGPHSTGDNTDTGKDVKNNSPKSKAKGTVKAPNISELFAPTYAKEGQVSHDDVRGANGHTTARGNERPQALIEGGEVVVVTGSRIPGEGIKATADGGGTVHFGKLEWGTYKIHVSGGRIPHALDAGAKPALLISGKTIPLECSRKTGDCVSRPLALGTYDSLGRTIFLGVTVKY